jgi:hypothetical protein
VLVNRRRVWWGASGMLDEVSIKSSGKSANLLNLSGISEIIP